MAELVQRYLWELLIATEIVFWVCIAVFLLFRYVFGWRKAGVVILLLFLASLLADIYLGWVDYNLTGEFSVFQFIVVIVVIYAMTAGLSDFRRLDAYIQRKIAHWKGEPEPQISVPLPPKYGREHARYERRGWLMHVVMFVTAQAVFFFLFGTDGQFSFSQLVEADFYRLWWEDERFGAYQDETLNQLVKVWFIILIIDGIISLSYTFFPRKEKREG